MASLIQQHGLYYVQFYDSARVPRRKRIPLRTKTERVADRLKVRAEDAFATGRYDPWRHGRQHEVFGWTKPPEQDLSTLGRAKAAFLDARSHLRPATLRTYDEVLRLFVDYHGEDLRVSHLTSSHVSDWLQHGIPSGTDLADATRRKYVTHLGYLFRYLIEQGWMDEDLSKQVALPKQIERAPKAMTEEHQRKLVQTIQAHHQRHAEDGRCNEYHYLILLVQLNPLVGLRAKELIHLQWSDPSSGTACVVDLDSQTLHVANEASGGFTTKSGKNRLIPLSQSAVQLLERAQRRLLPDGCPYVYHRNGAKLKYSGLAHAFYRFRKKAGLPSWVNLHSTRHAYGTRLAEAGTPIQVIARFMGHSTTSVTEQYMHVAPEQGHYYVDRAFD